jgi:hypothetical protein
VHVLRRFALAALQQPAVRLRVDVPLVAYQARAGTVATVPVPLRDKQKPEVPHMTSFVACGAQQHHFADLCGCVGLIGVAGSWGVCVLHVYVCVCVVCVCVLHMCACVYVRSQSCSYTCSHVYVCTNTPRRPRSVLLMGNVNVHTHRHTHTLRAPVPPQPGHMQGTPPAPRVTRALGADFPCMRTSFHEPNSRADGQTLPFLHLSQ